MGAEESAATARHCGYITLRAAQNAMRLPGARAEEPRRSTERARGGERPLTDGLVEHDSSHVLSGVLGLSDVGDPPGHRAAHPDAIAHLETVSVRGQNMI